MKKSVATNNTMKGRRVQTENNKNNKNTALKKVGNKETAVQDKKRAPPRDTVMLTQSEFDAILGAIGKLSMEKGK